MKNSFFGLLVGLVLMTVGCVTKNNTVTKVSTPVVVPGTTNVVYQTFERTDDSWSVNQIGSSVGNDGSFARFGFSVGGGTPSLQPVWGGGTHGDPFGTQIGNRYRND
jgi:hypothetical protein